MNNKNLNECHPELDSGSTHTGFRIKSGMTGIWIMLAAFGLTACSSAGPYVTNISRNKNGDLVVEKCMLEHNAFLGTVYNDNCTNQSI